MSTKDALISRHVCQIRSYIETCLPKTLIYTEIGLPAKTLLFGGMSSKYALIKRPVFFGPRIWVLLAPAVSPGDWSFLGPVVSPCEWETLGPKSPVDWAVGGRLFFFDFLGFSKESLYSPCYTRLSVKRGPSAVNGPSHGLPSYICVYHFWLGIPSPLGLELRYRTGLNIAQAGRGIIASFSARVHLVSLKILDQTPLLLLLLLYYA